MTELERLRREKTARSRHQARYWRNHDRDTYTCPDCGRTEDEVEQFDVHHRDGNPLNGDPENLVALCWTCHLRRHGKEPVSRTLEEWQAEFPAESEMPHKPHATTNDSPDRWWSA